MVNYKSPTKEEIRKKSDEIAKILLNFPSCNVVDKILNYEYRDHLTPLAFKEACLRYGIFEIHTSEFINKLSEFIKKFGKEIKAVEVCAGDGRLTFALNKTGLKIDAVDDKSWNHNIFRWISKKTIKYPTNIIKSDAIQYIKKIKPDLIIASWIPSFSDLDIQLVETGIPLIIIGEDRWGHTGSTIFWKRKDFKIDKLEEISKYNRSRNNLNHFHSYTFLVSLIKLEQEITAFIKNK